MIEIKIWEERKFIDLPQKKRRNFYLFIFFETFFVRGTEEKLNGFSSVMTGKPLKSFSDFFGHNRFPTPLYGKRREGEEMFLLLPCPLVVGVGGLSLLPVCQMSWKIIPLFFRSSCAISFQTIGSSKSKETWNPNFPKTNNCMFDAKKGIK